MRKCEHTGSHFEHSKMEKGYWAKGAARNQDQRRARAIAHPGLQPVSWESVVVHGDGSGLRNRHGCETLEGVKVS